MNDTDFKAFIDNAIKANPIEARVTRKIIKALKDAGTPVTSVWDTEENNPVKTQRDIMEQVFNLDVAYLRTATGSYVMLVLGNEWDVLSDYTLDLEDALKPVNEYIESHW